MRKTLIAGVCTVLLSAGTHAGANKDAAAAFARGDHAEAFRLWHAQAEQGDYGAQAMVAFLYHDGQGVAKDLVRAHMWFEISRSLSPANEQSWHDASDALEITAKEMTPAQIAEARDMAQTCQLQNYKNCD